MIKASDAITFEEELSVAPDLSPEDVDLGNRRKPILRAPSSRLEGKVAHASGSRLGRLVRMGNILLEDATLESAGDHVPHSTFLFRRTCLWSVLYLVFCLLLSLALFSYFYASESLVAVEVRSPTASDIERDFNKTSFRCPCTRTMIPLRQFATFRVTNSVRSLCEAVQLPLLRQYTDSGGQLQRILVITDTLCDMVDTIATADLAQLKDTVVQTLVAADKAGLQDLVQRRLDDQKIAYRRAFTLVNSVVSTTKSLDNQEMYQTVHNIYKVTQQNAALVNNTKFRAKGLFIGVNDAQAEQCTLTYTKEIKGKELSDENILSLRSPGSGSDDSFFATALKELLTIMSEEKIGAYCTASFTMNNMEMRAILRLQETIVRMLSQLNLLFLLKSGRPNFAGALCCCWSMCEGVGGV